VTATGLTLSWSAVVGATGYVVYQNGVMLPVVSGVTTSRTIAGLTASTSYNFSVAYKNSLGVLSSPSALVTVTTSNSPAPTAPTPTATGVTATGLTLNWTAVAGATGYVVYQNGVALPVVAGTVTSQTITGLTASTSYNFSVAYKNSAGVLSSPSAVFTVVTPSAPVAGAAPIPTATAVTATSLTLNWTAVAGATSYVVFKNGVVQPLVAGVGTSQLITGLTTKTSYNFRLSYRNTAGVLSATSGILTVITL
jgi:chitodextrinase